MYSLVPLHWLRMGPAQVPSILFLSSTLWEPARLAAALPLGTEVTPRFLQEPEGRGCILSSCSSLSLYAPCPHEGSVGSGHCFCGGCVERLTKLCSLWEFPLGLRAVLCTLVPRCLLCGCPKLCVYNKAINSFDALVFTGLLWLGLLFSWLMRMAIGNPLILLPTRVCNCRSNHFVADVNFVMRNTRFMMAGSLTDCFIA